MKYLLSMHAFAKVARRHKKLIDLALLTGVILCATLHTAAQTKSSGVYRIPFANDTTVKITNDFLTHKPLGRIDMVGTGGSTYRIVAAADGTIRYVVDNFNKQIDSGSGEPCTNNYVWIEHANGEWTKYSHMQMDSSTKKAKLKVGQFVKAGTYLGDEGTVGCASGNHLHFEVGVPRATNPISTVGGFLADNDGSKRNRVPRICGISGGIFVDGESYEARDVPGNLSPGSAEVARHGLPAGDYQCLFDQAVNADYRLEWVDGFNFKGKIYFNLIFRPEMGAKWSAVHNVNGNQYQAEFDKRKALGYRLKHVDSYLSGNQILYAAVFVKDGVQVAAYHGLSAADHQKRIDDLTAGPWRPKVISVVSIGGNRFYTALYENAKIGGWEAKSFLTATEYQSLADENKQKGRQLAYLNVYEHQGQPRFSAIWNSSTQGAFKARHDLSGSAYQQEWEAARKSGLLTRAVTGYADGGAVKYAAVWRK
ncbi:MAG: peptidoglycan DD-metalloendopeptidase family protein [Pyrinomonadaceae bacterium]